jgi:hypothetical protein
MYLMTYDGYRQGALIITVDSETGDLDEQRSNKEKEHHLEN